MLATVFDPAGRILTLRLEQDLLSSNIDAAARAFEAALSSVTDYEKLLIDLTACRMVDSVGLNLLFSVLNRAKERRIEPKVLIAKGNLERIMQVAQIGKIFSLEVAGAKPKA